MTVFWGPAGLIGFGTLFFLRVGREGEMMINTFGDDYHRYSPDIPHHAEDLLERARSGHIGTDKQP
jgi:hypothetical protein